MQINEDKIDANFLINRCQAGLVTINHIDYCHSLIVAPHQLIANWRPVQVNDLQPSDWDPVIALQPEVVLFGVGDQASMPLPALLAPLYQARIPVESMNTGAACRTYTILVAEQRRVVAALLIGS